MIISPVPLKNLVLIFFTCFIFYLSLFCTSNITFLNLIVNCISFVHIAQKLPIVQRGTIGKKREIKDYGYVN